jgi:hypothetical protein
MVGEKTIVENLTFVTFKGNNCSLERQKHAVLELDFYDFSNYRTIDMQYLFLYFSLLNLL